MAQELAGTVLGQARQHTDCVEWSPLVGCLAVASYEQQPADSLAVPDQSATIQSAGLSSSVREGCVILVDCATRLKPPADDADINTSTGHPPLAGMELTLPAAVFDCKWDPLLNRLGLALANGEVCELQISRRASAEATLAQPPFEVRQPIIRGHSRWIRTESTDEGEPAPGEGEPQAFPAPQSFSLASASLAASTHSSDDIPPSDLCLCLDWVFEAAAAFPDSPVALASERMITGYRSGTLAVWDVSRLPSPSPIESPAPLWTVPGAHSLEVWQVHSLDSWTFLSGSDDATMKLWDTRRAPSAGPVATNHRFFLAGVTCFASPKLGHWPGLSTGTDTRALNLGGGIYPYVASGSYDERLAMWDLRQSIARGPIFHSEPCGGGIWRLKWLVPDSSSIKSISTESSPSLFSPSWLAGACMYDGWKVWRLNPSQGSVDAWQHRPDFPALPLVWEWSDLLQPHALYSKGPHAPNSLAYGVDWLTSLFPLPQSSSGACSLPAPLAVCSFYDNLVSLASDR